MVDILHLQLQELLQVLEHGDLVERLRVVALDVLLLLPELLDVLLLLDRLRGELACRALPSSGASPCTRRTPRA